MLPNKQYCKPEVDCFVSGGFWDSPQAEPVMPVVKTEAKPEVKNKKKVTVIAPPKAENTPSVEFEMWCANMLLSWRNSGIDGKCFLVFAILGLALCIIDFYFSLRVQVTPCYINARTIHASDKVVK